MSSRMEYNNTNRYESLPDAPRGERSSERTGSLRGRTVTTAPNPAIADLQKKRCFWRVASAIVFIVAVVLGILTLGGYAAFGAIPLAVCLKRASDCSDDIDDIHVRERRNGNPPLIRRERERIEVDEAPVEVLQKQEALPKEDVRAQPLASDADMHMLRRFMVPQRPGLSIKYANRHLAAQLRHHGGFKKWLSACHRLHIQQQQNPFGSITSKVSVRIYSDQEGREFIVIGHVDPNETEVGKMARNVVICSIEDGVFFHPYEAAEIGLDPASKLSYSPIKPVVETSGP
jgi:hypothetical protein